jgi:hypothetical protein
VCQFVLVVGGHTAKNLAGFGIIELGNRVCCGFAENFTRFQTAFCTGDNSVTALVHLILATRCKHSERPHDSITDDVFGHGTNSKGAANHRNVLLAWQLWGDLAFRPA